MTSKKEAQGQARRLRKELKEMSKMKTVNVKEVSKGNWGVRLSEKGKRDKFNHRSYRQH